MQVGRQDRNVVSGQLIAKARHLRRRTPLGDHRLKLVALEPLQRLGDQGGADRAQTVVTMADGAMGGEENLGL